MEKNTQQDIMSMTLGYLGVFLIAIFLMSQVDALYSGDNFSYDLSGDFENITGSQIIENTSSINYSIDNLILTGKIPEIYDEGLFRIVVWGYKEQKPVTNSYSSGGGGGCTTSWKCSDWGECINGFQTRSCTKEKSYCYASKISLNQSCIVINYPSQNKTQNESQNNTIINIEPKKDNFVISWFRGIWSWFKRWFF